MDANAYSNAVEVNRAMDVNESPEHFNDDSENDHSQDAYPEEMTIRERRRMRLVLQSKQAAQKLISETPEEEDRESNRSMNRLVRTKSRGDSGGSAEELHASDPRILQIIENAFGKGADLYTTVLNVPRDSYVEQIRRAYFHRAMEFHSPNDDDQMSTKGMNGINDSHNGGNEGETQQGYIDDKAKVLKYRAVGLAYKILSNDVLRQLYDEYGIMQLHEPSGGVVSMKKDKSTSSKQTDEEPHSNIESNNEESDRYTTSNPTVAVITDAFGDKCSLYSDVLRIPVHANDEEIRQAYCMRAMFFHPNRQGENISEEGIKVASLRFRAVAVAYEILSNKIMRENYDKTGDIPHLEGRARKSEEKEDLQYVDDTMVKSSQEILNVINFSFGEDADLYTIVLRVPKNATDLQIHEAYLRRAMFFHPERQAGKDLSEEQLNRASLCFRAVTVAYKTLSNNKLKKVYDMTGVIYEIKQDAIKTSKVQSPKQRNESYDDTDKVTRKSEDILPDEKHPIVQRESTHVPSAPEFALSELYSEPNKIMDLVAFYQRSFEEFVESTVDDANDALQTFIDDVTDLLSPGDVDDNLSVYTDSVGSMDSIDDDFAPLDDDFERTKV